MVYNYYRQSTGIEDVNMQLDQGSTVSSQHYVKYHKLSVNLTTPLDMANISNLSGNITVTKLIPQVNDFFTANLATGEIGVFRVTTVEAVNYSLDTIYEIEFSIDTTSTIDPDRLASLEESVVKEYFYSKNSIYTQSDSLLLTDDHELVNKMERYIFVQTNEYVKTFSNGLLSIDIDDRLYYCPTVDSLSRAILTHDDLSSIDSRPPDNNLIEDFLLSYGPYKDLYFKVDSNTPKLNGKIDIALRLRDYIPSDIDYVVLVSDELLTGEDIPILSPFLYDGTLANPYFLYSDESLAPFQVLLRKYINEEAISNLEIINLMNEDITKVDKYYFMPLIIMVIKYKLNTLYSQ